MGILWCGSICWSFLDKGIDCYQQIKGSKNFDVNVLVSGVESAQAVCLHRRDSV